MNTLSKEFIAETKKEIQRLEGFVRSYQARIEALQDLLSDNSNNEAAPKKSSSRKKTSKSRYAQVPESEEGVAANA